jgi:O-antigen ligase
VMVIGLIWRYVPWFVAVPAGAGAIYVLLQSGSRGPLIAVVVALVVAVLLVRTRPLAVRTTAVLALVAAGLTIAYDLAPYYAKQRVADLLFRGEVSANQNARAGLFETAVNSISSHPFGIGWGNFENLGSDGNTYPHNIVLEALAEGGLIFGGIFLVWVAVSVWRARQASTGPVGAIAFALVVFLLTAATSTGDLNDNRTFFYALGIAVAGAGAGAAGISAWSRPSSSRRDGETTGSEDADEEPPVPVAGGRS